jgi:hypothetical protein
MNSWDDLRTWQDVSNALDQGGREFDCIAAAQRLIVAGDLLGGDRSLALAALAHLRSVLVTLMSVGWMVDIFATPAPSHPPAGYFNAAPFADEEDLS